MNIGTCARSYATHSPLFQPKNSVFKHDLAATKYTATDRRIKAMTNAGPSWTPDQLQSDPHANPQKATRVQSMFSAIAPSYDLNNRIHSFGLDQSWRKRTVREVSARLGSLRDKKILDVACGTGDLTELFYKAGANITGGDYTPAMLRLKTRHSTRSRLRLDCAMFQAPIKPSRNFSACFVQAACWPYLNLINRHQSLCAFFTTSIPSASCRSPRH